MKGTVLLASMLLSGCSTMITIAEDEGCDNLIYSGTRAAWANNHGGFIELPFTLVADTLVLPYTVPATAVDPCREQS